MPFKRFSRAGFPKTRAANSLRSIRPSRVSIFVPKKDRIFFHTGLPGVINSCVIRSASITYAPNCPNNRATVDFPVPPPPVSPMRINSFYSPIENKVCDSVGRIVPMKNQFSFLDAEEPPILWGDRKGPVPAESLRGKHLHRME